MAANMAGLFVLLALAVTCNALPQVNKIRPQHMGSAGGQRVVVFGAGFDMNTAAAGPPTGNVVLLSFFYETRECLIIPGHSVCLARSPMLAPLSRAGVDPPVAVARRILARHFSDGQPDRVHRPRGAAVGEPGQRDGHRERNCGVHVPM